MNRVILSGNVGADADIKDKVATFSLATSEHVKDKDITSWHRIVVFGEGRISFVQKCVKKGTALEIEGRIQYDTYEKEGVKQYTTSIIADKIEFAPSNNKKSSGDAPF